jgi:ATP-dependent DNA ligase
MKTSKISIKPPCPELRGNLAGMKYPAIAEIKSDGEFCFIHVDPTECFTVNKYGTVRQEFNKLVDIAQYVLGAGKHMSATFLGELCINDGKAGELYTLLSNKKNDALQLYVFDIIELDKKDLRNEDLITRKEILNEVLGGLKSTISPVVMVYNDIQVKAHFEYAVDKKWEGIVVKSLTGKLLLGPIDWVKIKAKDQTDYKVHLVDTTQERIEVEVPLPGIQTATGLNYVVVGCKAPNKYKQHIKVGDLVTIEHQGILSSGSLRHPVLIAKPEWR